MSMIDSDEPAIQKVDGRTKEGRAARAATQAGGERVIPHSEVDAKLERDFPQSAPSRAATRTSPRKSPRDANRDPTRAAGVVVGRDGEVLTRKRTGGVDAFDIPESIIPDGWSYQWNSVSVHGNADVVMDQTLGMYENGWRPVPAERHPGRFVPVGTKGQIVRGGQRLEERPLSLTEDARREEVATAKRLISDRNDSLKLSGVKNSMPDGFEMGDRKYRGTGGNIKMSIDRALDIEPPSHQLADPGE